MVEYQNYYRVIWAAAIIWIWLAGYGSIDALHGMSGSTSNVLSFITVASCVTWVSIKLLLDNYERFSVTDIPHCYG